MSIPKLNLKKYYCEKYEFHINTKLKSNSLPSLKKIDGLKELDKGTACIIEQNFKKNKAVIRALIIVQISESKKNENLHFLRTGFVYTSIDNLGVNDQKERFDFKGFCKFLDDYSTDSRSHAISHFDFPQSAFKTIIPLPYTREDLPLEQKIQIRGLDLELGEGEDTYRQHIAVYDSESISQRVGFLKIKENISEMLLVETLKKEYECGLLLLEGTNEK